MRGDGWDKFRSDVLKGIGIGIIFSILIIVYMLHRIGLI